MKHSLKKLFIVLNSLIIFFLSNQLSANSLNFKSNKKTYIEEREIINIFRESLSQKLLENKDFLIYNRFGDFSDSIGFEKAHFGMYRGEMKNLYHIKQDIINRSIVNSLKDSFKKTPIGKKIKSFEEELSKYFVVEYSKGKSDEQAYFYFLGRSSLNKMREEKKYKISLSSSLYPNPNSLEKDFSIKLKGNFYGTRINTFYDFYKRGWGFNLKSKELNSYLGTDLYFYSENYDEEKKLGLFMTFGF